MDLEYVKLDGDADDVAKQLLEPNLPSQMLDELRVVSKADMAELLVLLTRRMGKASIEKDELIRFAQKNRSALKGGLFKRGLMSMFPDFIEAAEATGGSFGQYMKYFFENLRHALGGDFTKMDMRSDKLFWLVFVLSKQLDSQIIDYHLAQAKLARPEVIQRISQHQLAYMLMDYADAIGSPQQASTTMLMLIAECALLAKEIKSLDAATSILAKYSIRGYRVETVDLLQRSVALLEKHHVDVRELRKKVAKLQAKQRRIGEDDF